jgi:hypothetical protein
MQRRSRAAARVHVYTKFSTHSIAASRSLTMLLCNGGTVKRRQTTCACLFGLVVGFGTHAVWVGTALLRTHQASEWTLEHVDAAEQAALPPELLALGVQLLGEKELASVLRNSVSLTGSMQGIPTKLFFSKSDGQGTVDLRAQVTAYDCRRASPPPPSTTTQSWACEIASPRHLLGYRAQPRKAQV